MLQAKVCLLGAFAVGKTSLVSRFVSRLFDHRYHTTVGVRIDKKTLTVGGCEVQLLLWDIAGEDAFHQVRESYLRGATGYFLVVDGTRRRTFDTAIDLQRRAVTATGNAPFVTLLNKADRTAEWELEEAITADLDGRGWPWRPTSALTGLGVEEAFVALAGQMLSRGLNPPAPP